MSMLRQITDSFAQLRRDLGIVGLRFAGKHPPPLVDRKQRARRSAPALHASARSLVVARTVVEAKDVVTLVLEDPTGAPFEFQPGQFFTVLVDVDGETVPRNYSASNLPGTRELHLTVKKKVGGRVSGSLVELAAGERLRVLGPFGSFTVTPSRPGDEGRALLLVAGGVGITPLVAIARSVLATEPTTRVALVYGNRSRADIAFEGALAALAAEHEGRFVVRHVLETAASDLAADVGRLDRATFARIKAELGLPSPVHYVCGPEGMQDEVLAAIGEAPVRTERFTVARRRELTPGAPRAVTVRAHGREYRTVALAGATLLEAGLAAGAPMPSSCSVGGCGACRVKLVSGEVELEEPNCLTADERRRGYVLACVGRAKDACTVAIDE
jgi:ferredoxin-NADP reductase